MKDFYLLNKQSDEEIMNKTSEIVKEVRAKTKLSLRRFSEFYHIPFSTLQGWERGNLKLTSYVLELLYTRIMYDFGDAPINRNKKDLSCVKEFFVLNKGSDEDIRNNTQNIVRDLRKITRLSQGKFGELYHIPKITLAAWEVNRNYLKSYLLEFLYTRVMLDFKESEV